MSICRQRQFRSTKERATHNSLKTSRFSFRCACHTSLKTSYYQKLRAILLSCRCMVYDLIAKPMKMFPDVTLRYNMQVEMFSDVMPRYEMQVEMFSDVTLRYKMQVEMHFHIVFSLLPHTKSTPTYRKTPMFFCCG